MTLIQAGRRLDRLQTSRLFPWLLIGTIMLAITGITWHTLGLHATALYELWGSFYLFDRGTSPLSYWISGVPSRPFLAVWEWLAYQLDPNSFFFLNLINAFLFFSQGIALFALIRRLRPNQIWFAFAVTLIYVIYPADNSLANSRYMGYTSSILFFVLSLYFCIDYWQRKRPLALVGLLASSLFNLGMVEVTYPLVIIAPLVLIWLEPSHRITPRIIRASVWWYVAPCLMLIYTAILYMQGYFAYQGGLLISAAQVPVAERLIDTIQSILHAYGRVFFDSWLQAFQHVDWQSSRLLAGVAIAVLCAILIRIVDRHLNLALLSTAISPPDNIKSRRTQNQLFIEREWQWFVIGIIIIGLGFVLYAFLPTHRLDTERVYLVSSLGGAIVIVTFVSFISKRLHRNRFLVILIVPILIGVAFQSDLVDVLRVRTASEQEQSIMAQVVQQAPNLDKAKLLLILDPTQQLTTSMIFALVQRPGFIEPAFQYLYHSQSFKMRVCDTMASSTPPAPFSCSLSSTSVTLYGDTGDVPQIYSLDSVIAFEHEGETRLKLLTEWPIASASSYQPLALISTTEALPYRVSTMFSRWPFYMENPLNEHPVQSINVNSSNTVMFLDHPTPPFITYGWYGSALTSNRSTMVTWLNSNYHYQIRLNVTGITSADDLTDQWHILVNNIDIPIAVQTDQPGQITLTGVISEEIVARDLQQTTITIEPPSLILPLPPQLGLDHQINGFEVKQLTITALN